MASRFQFVPPAGFLPRGTLDFLTTSEALALPPPTGQPPDRAGINHFFPAPFAVEAVPVAVEDLDAALAASAALAPYDFDATKKPFACWSRCRNASSIHGCSSSNWKIRSLPPRSTGSSPRARAGVSDAISFARDGTRCRCSPTVRHRRHRSRALEPGQLETEAVETPRRARFRGGPCLAVRRRGNLELRAGFEGARLSATARCLCG